MCATPFESTHRGFLVTGSFEGPSVGRFIGPGVLTKDLRRVHSNPSPLSSSSAISLCSFNKLSSPM